MFVMYSCCKQVGITPKPKCLIGSEKVKSDSDPVKNLVFSIDPRTGLPRNDIGVYMSKDTSPEVRRYIENMFLNEQQPIEHSRDVDDQTLMDTLPEHNESLFEYEKRMSKLLDDEREKIRFDKLRKQRISRLKKQGFSDDEISEIMS